MEILFLKQFIIEIYLTIIIFYQLLLNTTFINKTKFKEIGLDRETDSQNIIFFFTLIFLLINSKINGIFPNLLLINNDGTLVFKIVLILLLTGINLILFNKSVILQNINFFEYFTLFFLVFLAFCIFVNYYEFFP